MRKLFLVTLLILTFGVFSQTEVVDDVKFNTITEQTDFTGNYNLLPLMRSSGRMNGSFIHSDSLVLKGSLGNLVPYTGATSDIDLNEKKIINIDEIVPVDNSFLTIRGLTNITSKLSTTQITNIGTIQTTSLSTTGSTAFNLSGGKPLSTGKTGASGMIISRLSNGTGLILDTPGSVGTAPYGFSLSCENLITSPREFYLPDASGTLALLSDIPNVDGLYTFSNGLTENDGNVEIDTTVVALKSDLDELDLSKQDKLTGKNLFDKSSTPYIEDSFISSTGSVNSNTVYDVYIIQIEEDTDYYKRFKTSASYDVFLDKDFNQIGVPTNTFTKVFVNDAKYLLISVQKAWIDTYQIEEGLSFTGYEEYTSDKPLYNLNNIMNPKNVVNVGSTILTEGSYYSDSGAVIDSNYSYVEFSPEYGKAYYISTNGLDSNPSDFNFLTLLDSNNNVIGKESSKSFYKSMFFDIDVKKVIVSSDAELKPFILEEGKGSLGGYSFKGDLIANTQTTFGKNNYVKKNITINGVVDFSANGFTDFTFGKGVGTYFSGEISIDDTNIYIPSIAGGVLTYAHGLTITDTLYFILEVGEKWCNLKVSTDALNFFESITFLFYADGQMYLESSTDCYVYNCNIAFRDLQTNVRCYGDSYLTSSDPNRWTFQANTNLGTDFFINNLTGGDSLQLYEALLNDLDFGSVKTIMWCLGMNDTPDVDSSTPDPTWLKTILAVKSLCKLIGVDMVVSTIPNVPSRYHQAKSNYIYNDLGVRYADFAEVVNNGVNYDWFSGMLATDNVHPTAKGAFTLALEAIKVVPELYK